MSEILSQKDLVKAVAEKTGLTQEKSKAFIEYFFDSIKKELKNSDSVAISGFGTFRKKWIEESDGINPSTLEKIKIPAHFKILFKPSAPVARLFNKKYENLKPILIERPEKFEKEEAENSVQIQDSEEDDDDEKDSSHSELDSESTNENVAESKTEVQEEKKSEPQNQTESEKKSGAGKIIAIAIVALVILIILIILLAKGCSSSKSEPGKLPPKTEAVQTKPKVAETKPEPVKTEPVQQVQIQKEEKPAPANPAVTKAEPSFTFKDFKVQSGSNYHTIALQEYKNRHLWPVIYNANKNSSPNPDVLSSGATIKVPQIKSVSEDAENIKSAMLAAFNGYKNQISSANSDFENSEKKRLAAGVLVSAENLYPGFIEANKSKIGSDYAEYATEIFKRNYSR